MKLKLVLAGALVTFGLVTPAVSGSSDWNQQNNSWKQADYRDNNRGRDYDRYDRHDERAAWKLIGSRNVSYRTERDIIPAFGREGAQQIKLCVSGQAVRMMDLDVRFGNGGHQNVPVRDVIGAGQCTRNIDLKGKRRDIASIGMVYRSAGRPRGGATVQVYAR